MNKLPAIFHTQIETGFTIVETITALTISTIVAAVSFPSLAGFWGDYATRLAQTNAHAQLLILKREAQRTNRTCQVTFSGNQATVNPADCLVSMGRSLSDSGWGSDLGVTVSGTLSSVTFSPLATITPSSNGTLRFSHAWTNTTRCLVLSQPLGVIRLGTIQQNACVKDGRS
ncbi:type II secretion system protein [Synechococcus elongatus IITB4]|uniref:pilus assembly FimT family protein n=1 Tax=Synechococcus elongatus TaxID=32046 RepID=UPI0030CC826A